jgi:chemotaxis protein CheX
VKSLNELQSADGSHKEWLPLIELATREVFETMLGCQLALPEIAVDEAFGVTAMVGLAGQICGLLTVRCGAGSAALVASKMLGVELDRVGCEMPDALGEVCNMVAGNFKNKIAGLGEGCMLSPPTVITGSDYTLHSQAALEVRLLFESMPIVISLLVQS